MSVRLIAFDGNPLRALRVIICIEILVVKIVSRPVPVKAEAMGARRYVRVFRIVMIPQSIRP